MQPRRFLEGMQPNNAIDRALNGRSSIIGAMTLMFGLSFVLTLTLGWVPVVGPFIGPVIGGYMGGRKAGSLGRAVLASIFPASSSATFSCGAVCWRR